MSLRRFRQTLGAEPHGLVGGAPSRDALIEQFVAALATSDTASFNDMLTRLEDSFRRLSDFSSDLAHELRTPIGNVMTQVQVAVSKARSPSSPSAATPSPTSPHGWR